MPLTLGVAAWGQVLTSPASAPGGMPQGAPPARPSAARIPPVRVLKPPTEFRQPLPPTTTRDPLPPVDYQPLPASPPPTAGAGRTRTVPVMPDLMPGVLPAAPSTPGKAPSLSPATGRTAAPVRTVAPGLPANPAKVGKAIGSRPAVLPPPGQMPVLMVPVRPLPSMPPAAPPPSPRSSAAVPAVPAVTAVPAVPQQPLPSVPPLPPLASPPPAARQAAGPGWSLLAPLALAGAAVVFAADRWRRRQAGTGSGGSDREPPRS
ncbi:MAG: hypothetical protein ACK55H_11815 [Cyanobacteriota bacterium]